MKEFIKSVFDFKKPTVWFITVLIIVISVSYISYTKNRVENTVSNLQNENIDIAATDGTDLDACISEAILASNADQHSGDFSAEAHTVLKTVETGNTVTVYAMALHMRFGYAGSGFFETGGSHMPVAITFERDSTGKYKLLEYWIPQDGSYYMPSLKGKFPADIIGLLDTQKYITKHVQSCYAQAIKHGSVSVYGHLKKLVETICSSPTASSNVKDYIDAHPIEYREMIYYGDYTLRNSFELFEKGGQTGIEGQIMAAACRDIIGNVQGDVLFNTGQDWYEAFKAYAESLRKEYDDEYIQKNERGAWILLQVLSSQMDNSGL